MSASWISPLYFFFKLSGLTNCSVKSVPNFCWSINFRRLCEDWSHEYGCVQVWIIAKQRKQTQSVESSKVCSITRATNCPYFVKRLFQDEPMKGRSAMIISAQHPTGVTLTIGTHGLTKVKPSRMWDTRVATRATTTQQTLYPTLSMMKPNTGEQAAHRMYTML